MASATTERQDRDVMRETHQLADTTYRNIEEFMDDMKNMVTASKAYYKSLQAMALASDNFYGLMESVGAKASNLPGAVRKLGDCMLDMVASHRHMSENHEDWVESLNTDFIVPMEMKLKEERKNMLMEHRNYRLESGRRIARAKKTRKMVKKSMKKKSTSRNQSEKQIQLKHMLIEHTDNVRTTCVEGLRKALIEERKLYCFCVDHFCSVLQNQIAYNAASHRVLSTRVNEWSSLCSSPDELPAESLALLSDPRSARAFPPPASDSRMHAGSMLAQALQMGAASPANLQRRKSCRVKALYNHQNSSGEQLEFSPGDLIDAVDDEQDGWQYGENTRTGATGWFPVQYVNKIWPSPGVNRHRRVQDSTGAATPSPGSHGGPHPLQMGTSATEREYLHHQLQQGSGSRRSSQASTAMSFR